MRKIILSALLLLVMAVPANADITRIESAGAVKTVDKDYATAYKVLCVDGVKVLVTTVTPFRDFPVTVSTLQLFDADNTPMTCEDSGDIYRN